MILLDTNVVSELYKPKPHASVIGWLDAQPIASLFLCTPVLAELRFGMERLDPGRRRDFLNTAIARLEAELYLDRILTFDIASAAAYGRIVAARQRDGEVMQQMDACIAAIALAHGAALATRDTRGFANIGLDLINPFEAPV